MQIKGGYAKNGLWSKMVEFIIKTKFMDDLYTSNE